MYDCLYYKDIWLISSLLKHTKIIICNVLLV